MTKSQCLTLGIALGIWAALLIKPVVSRHLNNTVTIHVDTSTQKHDRADDFPNCPTHPGGRVE